MVKKAKEGTQAPKGWTPFDASAHKESPERATRLSNAAHKAWATRRAQGWKPKGLAPLSLGDTCPRCGQIVETLERETSEAQEAEAYKRHLAAKKANETRKLRAEEAQRESEREARKAKRNAKRTENGVNAVGKPYGRNFDPKYKVKHKVESIRRLAKPQKGIPFVVEEPLSGKKLKKVRVAA